MTTAICAAFLDATCAANPSTYPRRCHATVTCEYTHPRLPSSKTTKQTSAKVGYRRRAAARSSFSSRRTASRSASADSA
jgi:hypothetical protein